MKWNMFEEPTNHGKMIALGTSRGLEIIDSDSIVRVEAISNYSKLFFTNGRSLVVAKVLSWFEDKLAPLHFSRVHRSHLVNMRFIRSYKYLDGTAVILTTNETLSVSRRKRTGFRKAFYAYYSANC